MIIDIKNNKINDFNILIPWINKLAEKENSEQFLSDQFSLENNPGAPPIEIIRQGYKSIFDWITAQKTKLNEIKISIIGDGKVGKTSLLKRLKHNTFSQDEEQTEGINIDQFNFGELETFKEHPSLKNIYGFFWDFGGQEIMSSTHKFFLTKRTIYILVCESRKDGQLDINISEWMRKIRTYGGNSKIIIVINKTDLVKGFSLNEYELKKEFPQIVDIFEISAKTKENIGRLKQMLADTIPKAELFSNEIDVRWIKLKNILREKTGNNSYLSKKTVVEICINQCNINDEDERLNAVTFLNDLGIVLHFDNFFSR